MRLGLVIPAALALCACATDPVSRGPAYPTDPGDGPACAHVPWPDEWEYVGTAFEPGEAGDFDYLLWGGFGGSAIRWGDEVLFYFQGARGYNEKLHSPITRSIGLAVSRDGTSFVKDPASPVIEWMPTAYEEEGATSVTVVQGEDGEIVAFYGANTGETPTTVNADGRWAVSTDGRTFADRGIALDHADADLFASGDELFPVAALRHEGMWYVYYLPNGPTMRGELGVAWGPTPDGLTHSAGVRSLGAQVIAWGMQTAVRICGDVYALFLNEVGTKTMTVQLVDLESPEVLGEPLVSYRFPEEDGRPEFVQGAVLLDREAGYWYMYYRTGGRSRYDVRRARLTTSTPEPVRP